MHVVLRVAGSSEPEDTSRDAHPAQQASEVREDDAKPERAANRALYRAARSSAQPNRPAPAHRSGLGEAAPFGASCRTPPGASRKGRPGEPAACGAALTGPRADSLRKQGTAPRRSSDERSPDAAGVQAGKCPEVRTSLTPAPRARVKPRKRRARRAERCPAQDAVRPLKGKPHGCCRDGTSSAGGTVRREEGATANGPAGNGGIGNQRTLDVPMRSGGGERAGNGSRAWSPVQAAAWKPRRVNTDSPCAS